MKHKILPSMQTLQQFFELPYINLFILRGFVLLFCEDLNSNYHQLQKSYWSKTNLIQIKQYIMVWKQVQ